MSLTYDEARARAARISRVAYAIDLDLTSRETFGCRTTVTFDLEDPRATTFLELADAQDLRLTVNDAAVPAPAYDGTRITLHDLKPVNEVVVEARIPYVNDGDGMHTVTDPADDATYVAAYAGMDLAHRVFACFDQPDLKAPISLTVTAPADWTVLGNGRLDSHEGAAWRFTTTPPISTYLFTVCAGPWASRTWEHAGLPFGWHARASLATELDRDFENMKEVTEACFDFYTRTFDEPYPFDSYDQVMGPGHNWGAMETAGCVTFRDEYLPRNQPDAGEVVDRATVIAHEMAHMWFGDLVTMKWWQDTWLNESFADFMGYHVAHEAGVAGSWPDFSLNRKPTGYAADARRSTHPIAEDAEHLVDVDTAFTNFDMITYAKGASVLHQLVIWLGWETFVEGTNVYLTRHRFGNAELADFLEALDSVTDRDVRGWAEAYLRTTGFDTIRVSRDGEVPVLERDGSRPHRFTVAALDGSAGPGTTLVDLGSEPVALTSFAGLPVLPNAADEAYADVLLDDASWQGLVDGLSELSEPLQRAVAWSNAFTRVRSGRLTAPAFMGVVEAHLGRERDPVVFDSVLRRVRGMVLTQWTSPEALAAAQASVASVCTTALDAGDGDRALAAMRGLAASTRDVTLLGDWLESGRARPGLEIDRDTRWVAVRRLVVLGAAGADLVATEAAADRSSSGHQASLTALASRPDAAAKADAWRQIIDPTTSNRDFDALVAGLWTPGQEDLCAPYLDRYLEDAPRVAERSQSFAADIGFAVPRIPMAVARLQEFRDRLDAASAGTDNTVLRRGWRDRVDDYDVALLVRAAG
ncbi:aminopeptidase N [Nocardioides cynanchi]|uniref:aminopeptidase N n=1 Tax=Nocardioides cynanchi TaxID=2558918 RepID=UPI001243AFBF|nr:aminopeptidase N [Nocardioides cynanchi]